jgi:hypothetical protein
MDIPRPDEVNLAMQGERGPFGPLLILLNASTDVNEWSMRQREYTPLLKSGVVYKPEPPKSLQERGEEFASVDTVYQRGWGDCDDLAPIYAAELRVKHGIPAKPCIKWKWLKVPMREAVHLSLVKSRGHRAFVDVLLVHVLTAYSLDEGVNWIVCDPCIALGMKGDY